MYKACTYLALITTHISGQSKGESDKNPEGESRSLGGLLLKHGIILFKKTLKKLGLADTKL